MEKSPSLILLFGVILFTFVGLFAVLLHETDTPLTNKDFNKHTIYAHDDVAIRVDIVDSNIERQVGLSGRDSLAPGYGMLFIFKTDNKWRIWMKDMKFGIDILWLAEDGTVLDINEFAYPESYPFVFKPRVPARYVLEVAAGFSGANGIRIGDKIDLNL